MTDRMPRLMILLPEEMLAEIDQYCRTEPDILSRTEAIRRLIRAGLDAAKWEPPSGRRASSGRRRGAR
jgi:metal-responsive CopG/Arc/MetJ family transcriptional regulator